MLLTNLRLPDDDGLYDISVQGDRITHMAKHPLNYLPKQTLNSNCGEFATISPEGISDPPHPTSDEPRLDFNGALAFPGLINSHDHLDFNLFPRLGNRTYSNYTQWGPDIHSNNRKSIDPILNIPKHLRTQWGIYKNLLNGFTTVVNHGEYLETPNSPITVFQDCFCLHSVGFETNWKWKLNHPAKTGRPFALHVGEGTDAAATSEIDDLIRWNILRRPIIGIHGVAMTEEQAAAFHALVWCPASNFFLLEKTAAVDRLHKKTPVLFGTDSTLTSGWNAWEQIRLARQLQKVPDSELLAMLTANPAAAWGLEDRGALATGKRADLVIAKDRPGLSATDTFFASNPKDLLLVIHAGRIKLFDPSLLGPITEKKLTTEDFHISPPDGKYVAGDLASIMEDIRHYYPEIVFHGMTG